MIAIFLADRGCFWKMFINCSHIRRVSTFTSWYSLYSLGLNSYVVKLIILYTFGSLWIVVIDEIKIKFYKSLFSRICLNRATQINSFIFNFFFKRYQAYSLKIISYLSLFLWGIPQRNYIGLTNSTSKLNININEYEYKYVYTK